MNRNLLPLLVAALGFVSSLLSAVEPGFVPIFNGRNLDGWQGLGGDTSSYYAENGELICKETGKVHIFTVKEYANFILRLEIKMDPGGNNGVGIRTRVSRQPHLEGNELQVLDDPYYARGIPREGKAPKDWVPLKNYQHHGSIYGVVPAKPGHLKPAGQWNQQEVVCDGRRLKVTLNGTVIVDANLDEVTPIDGLAHPGLYYTKGHIGLHAHGNYGAKVYFRNLRIKELPATVPPTVSTEDFARTVAHALPEEKPFAYHERIAQAPVHRPRRSAEARPQPGELALPDQGWKIVWPRQSSPVLAGAVKDFADYLATSMQVRVTAEGQASLTGWRTLRQCIIVGTRAQMPGCGAALKGPKDYEITVNSQRITVCGFDERGAMFGLYHLESRMNLREAPFLPVNLRTTRHSLYDARMVLSGLGWMEWPDALLAHLAHDGFDAIFASIYANPNGDRTTAESSTDFYARLLYRVRHQKPARVRDLVNRAARFGIKVYTPIIYQYLGTPESEAGLRRLVRDIVKEFPDIQGYVLLTEGFWYKKWGGGHGASKEYVQDWARNWCKAVGIVAEECHRVNPAIEVLPWEYNINFRPDNVDQKRYFIQQLPADTIPLLTWENGKAFELDGLRGYLRDYSLNQIGPAEVTEGQIAEVRARSMKVYSKADSFASWQFGTIPYLPAPYQWHRRYQALEKFGVNGTLESWSNGYKPNFITELRSWYCWSDAPAVDELLEKIATRDFGIRNHALVLQAWRHFSEASRLVPDTGPNMGTNNAIGNPLFFQEPPLRTTTFTRAWSDHQFWMGHSGGRINPYWPFTVARMVFVPDFTNRANRAEAYARRATGVEVPPNTKILPVFLKYLRLAADEMEAGLKLYRAAALASPEAKRPGALREVVVAEQIQRMMQSNAAILEFEDLRLQLAAAKDRTPALTLLDRMESIARDEIARTGRSLLAATRDSRLGFQHEQDYVYTPYSLREKLASLRETVDVHLAGQRGKIAALPR